MSAHDELAEEVGKLGDPPSAGAFGFGIVVGASPAPGATPPGRFPNAEAISITVAYNGEYVTFTRSQIFISNWPADVGLVVLIGINGADRFLIGRSW